MYPRTQEQKDHVRASVTLSVRAVPRPAPVQAPRSGKAAQLDIAVFSALHLLDADETFVRSLYLGILGREPDLDGQVHHVNKLQQGMSRDGLRRGFLESNELRLRKALADDVFVGNLYRELLDREGDDEEIDHQVGLLAAGLSRAAMIQTFLSNPGYRPAATCAAKLSPILSSAIRAPRVSISCRMVPAGGGTRPLNGPLLAIPLLPRSSVEWGGLEGNDNLAVVLPARLTAMIKRAVIVDGDGRTVECGAVEVSTYADRAVASFARPRAAYPARANVVVELVSGHRARVALPDGEAG